MPKHYKKNAPNKLLNEQLRSSQEIHHHQISHSSQQQQQHEESGDIVVDIATLAINSPQKGTSSNKASDASKSTKKKHTKSKRSAISKSASILTPSRPHHFEKRNNKTNNEEEEGTRILSGGKATLPRKSNSAKGVGKNKKTTIQAIENNKNITTPRNSKNILGYSKKQKIKSEHNKGKRGNGPTRDQGNQPHRKHSSKRLAKSESFYRGNFRYSTTTLKGRKTAKSGEQRSSIHKHVQNNIVDKATKVKLIKENAKKRDKRIVQTLKRRKKIDKDRVKRRQLNSGGGRQERLKKLAQEQRIRSRMISSWAMAIPLGSRIQAAMQTVQKFRQYREQVEIEDRAARIITRQMQILKFKIYRKRVRGAIRVLASVFLVKVRMWKNSRRRIASDRVLAFLLALEKENRESGGCLALIVKGKKWRAYRMKIIVLQRLWRQRLRIISAQVLLIDLQWQQKQHELTKIEVEKIHTEEEARVIAENEKIDNINRTRKLIKLKPLPRKRCDTRDEIHQRLKRGFDFLSLGHIVPTEIRHELIRDMLKHLQCFYLNQLESFDKALEKYEEEMKDRQRRRALLVGFSGNSVVNTWVWGKSQSRSNIVELDQNNILPPSKPFFHVVLGEAALHTLMSLGKRYVEDLRQAWNPGSMKIIALPYMGKTAAEVHFKENPHIVATELRNERFL